MLVRGGRLTLTVGDQPERMRLLGVFLEALAGAGAAPPPNIPVGPPFFRFADDAEFAGLLRGQGLDDLNLRTIAFTHRVGSPDELWSGVLAGTVRTSALFLRQPDDVQRQIRGALVASLSPTP